MMQVDNLEKFLAWVRSSPCQFTISSMSGGYVHAKFLVPCDKAIPTPREQWHREVKEAEAIEDAIEDRDELMNQCYEDGFRDGRLDMYHEDHGEHKQHDEPEIKVIRVELGEDDKYRKGYEDGFRDGRREYADVEGIELPEFYLNELNKPVSIVKENGK